MKIFPTIFIILVLIVSTTLLFAQSRQTSRETAETEGVEIAEPAPAQTDILEPDMSRAKKREQKVKGPELKLKKHPHHPVHQVDTEETAKNIGKICTPPAERFYFKEGDEEGFCGYKDVITHCLPHYIYVHTPNGSVNNYFALYSHGAEGYMCVLDVGDPAFSAPPPGGACPDEDTHFAVSFSFPVNKMQYTCITDITTGTESDNIQDRYECLNGYEKIIDEYFYLLTCGLDGFIYLSQCDTPLQACGTSGASASGTNDVYVCGFPE